MFFTAEDGERMITRSKEIYDRAIPSGNSTAALNFLRLAHLTGDLDWEKKASEMFQAFGGTISSSPYFYCFFLTAGLFYFAEKNEVVIVIGKDKKDTIEFKNALNKTFLPFTVKIVYNPKNDNKAFLIYIPFLKEMSSLDEKSTVYICSNYSCKAPINTINAFEKILEKETNMGTTDKI